MHATSSGWHIYCRMISYTQKKRSSEARYIQTVTEVYYSICTILISWSHAAFEKKIKNDVHVYTCYQVTAFLVKDSFDPNAA